MNLDPRSNFPINIDTGNNIDKLTKEMDETKQLLMKNCEKVIGAGNILSKRKQGIIVCQSDRGHGARGFDLRMSCA